MSRGEWCGSNSALDGFEYEESEERGVRLVEKQIGWSERGLL